MIVYQVTDWFDALSTKVKTLVVAGFCVLVLALFAFAFVLGVVKGREWTTSKYLDNEAKRNTQIAQLEADAKRHTDNETQLAAENALLKKTNEATAEILAGRDKKAAADAAKKFVDLQKQRQDHLDDIDADNNFDSQLCGMCDDAKRAGHPLSAATCARCTAAK